MITLNQGRNQTFSSGDRDADGVEEVGNGEGVKRFSCYLSVLERLSLQKLLPFSHFLAAIYSLNYRWPNDI